MSKHYKEKEHLKQLALGQQILVSKYAAKQNMNNPRHANYVNPLPSAIQGNQPKYDTEEQLQEITRQGPKLIKISQC